MNMFNIIFVINMKSGWHANVSGLPHKVKQNIYEQNVES